MDRKVDDTEQANAESESKAPVETGPENAIMARVHALTPQDHEALARYLYDFPNMRDQILAWANEHLGNHVVEQAMSGMGQAAEKSKEDESFAAEVMGTIQDKDDSEFQAYMMGTIVATDNERSNGKDAGASANFDEMVAAYTDAELDAYWRGYLSIEAKDVKPVQPEPQAQAEQQAPTEATPEVAVEAVAQMDTSDADLLGATMAENPAVRGEILTEAVPVLGTEVVAEAVKVESEEVKAEPVTEAAPQAAEAKNEVEEEQAAPAHSHHWVSGAQRYNQRHAELVAEFIQLTGAAATTDGGVDPNFVAAWQSENGVSPDGRVGPMTVTAAREGANKKPKVTPMMIEHCLENPLDNECLA